MIVDRRIGNINALRRRAPHSWPRSRDITYQTRTRNVAGANATATVAVTLCLWAIRGYAQTGAPLTIDPAMAKGPATAPVTIVEFSDYQ
jgi:hypothetical protein